METEDEKTDATTTRGRFVRALFLGLLLIAATVAAYQQVWHAGYVWDDDVYVTNNQLLTAPDGLKRIWFSLDSPSQYFPLVYTTFRIEHAIWGLNPAGYHWVNIVLHTANALLLWRLLYVLRVPGSWLAAALFALHPVQVESVAWITERKNVLMGFFFLLALLAWVKFVAGKHRGELKYYGLALLFYLFALFSKTTACTLPAALVLISWLKRETVSRQRLLQIVPFVLLGVGMGLVAIWWERYHQGTHGGIFSLGIPERMLIAAHGFWFYLGKLAWPSRLAFSYPRWPISAQDAMAYVWSGACVLLALAIWLLRRFLGRGPELAFLFFAATLAPVLGFVMLYTFRYSFVADHYQYLASIGPLALVASAINTTVNPLGRIKYFLLPVIYAALLVPLGWRTWRQGAIYANGETLWRATIAAYPESWMAQHNLGIKLVDKGELDDAIEYFEEALRLDPNQAEAHFSLANTFFRQGRMDAARPHYEKALELNPRIVGARTDFSYLLLQRGEVREALAQLEEAVKLRPRSAPIRSQLGTTLVSLGRIDDAIAQFNVALEIDPDSTEAHYGLGNLLLRQGKMAEARAHAERAVTALPNDSAARTTLGTILSSLGKNDEAMIHFQKALDNSPDNGEAHFNLANTLFLKRDFDGAIEHYRKTSELRPTSASTRQNLANAYAASGRLEEAVAEYKKALEISPDYALAHKNLATALNSLGRYNEAMEHLQASWKLEAQPKSAPPGE